MNEKSSIFESSLLIRHDLGEMPRLNSTFIQSLENKAHLANQILIYDQLVIPTHDFGIVGAIINWLGRQIFEQALDDGVFSFVRTKGLLGYVGNGHGINSYQLMEDDSSKHFQWWQSALFAEPEIALVLQLENLCPEIPKSSVPELVQKILKYCFVSQYDNEAFKKYVEHETYVEIQQSQVLTNEVKRLVKTNRSTIDLKRLPGISSNQIRAGIRNENRDAIDLVLRIAEFHRDLLMAAEFPKADLYVSEGVETLLAQKISRQAQSNAITQGFTKLLDLNNLPDIEAAVLDGVVDLNDLWSLRQTKESCEFRNWLRIASPEDSRDLERLFTRALGSEHWISSTPVRLLRFVLTTAVGALEPVSGSVAGAADSFFAERWLGGYSPKLFFDRYRTLLEK